MPELHIVNYKDYHRSSIKPRGFKEFCEMYDTQGKITGLWETTQWDPKTGEVRQRIWNTNVLTDQGAVNILTAAIASAVPAAVFNNILITNNDGSTTLTGAGFTAGQTGITSLPCAATPAAIPSGTYLQLDYGTGSVQGGYNASGVLPTGTAAIITSGITAQGATSITVLSFTSAAVHSAGAAIVPVPNYSDNPANAGLTSNATTPLSKYSGNLAGGAFTYLATPGGAGGRSCQVIWVAKNATNGGSVPNGGYSSEWLVNVASNAGAGNYVNHNINSISNVNDSNNLTITAFIKL